MGITWTESYDKLQIPQDSFIVDSLATVLLFLCLLILWH